MFYRPIPRPALIIPVALTFAGCSNAVQYMPLQERLETEGSLSYSGTGVLTHSQYPRGATEENPAGSTEPVASPYTLTLTKDDEGALTATLLFDGQTYELGTMFPSGDGLYNDPEGFSPKVSVFNNEGLFEQAPSREYVAAIYSDWHDTFYSQYTSNFFIIGDQTIVADIPTNGSASYSGRFYANGNLADASDHWFFRGPIVLDATFETDKTTVSGTLQNEYASSTGIFQDILIDQAELADDGTYTSTLTIDEASCIDITCRPITNSELTGGFYGPEAGETGGIFQFTTSGEDGTPLYVSGYFTGVQE